MRRLILMAVTLGLVLSSLVAVVGTAGAAPAAAPAIQPQATYVTTTVALNLRKEPSLNAKVLYVLPKGTKVRWTDQVSNGFRYVVYENTANGTPGWAWDAFLAPVNPAPGPIVGQAVVAIALNLRSGPSTGDAVIRVMAKGATVDITNTVVNGFRFVYHNGKGGWAFDQYLAPAGGEGPALFTTTSAVNLRAQPNASAPIKLVVPAGAVVRDYDLAPLVNGYRGVDYNGTVGWVYDAFLD